MATLLVVILGLGVFALIRSAGSDVQNAGSDVQNFSYAGQPGIGSPNAPVKLMEFGDFKCPACKAFHDTIYPQLKKDYIDTGKVQMFFSNYQFIGPDSITAGMAGEAIYKQNKDAFWKYYDAVYTNQKEESQIWATPEFLIDLVKKHVPGVDATKLSQDLKNKTYQKEVEADNQLAKKSGVTSVPAIFVNGKQVEDSLNYEAIKKAIDEELKK